jgi:hypothetical protein
LIHVQPDSEQDRAVLQLRKPARDLAPVEHDVVRPLELRGEPGRALDDDRRGDPGDERQLRCAPLGGWAQQHREKD